ncbi:hypothetical protein I6A60_18975 [Frankia sp. AgB1.9]|uniref:hypothetical protein n=1 Tax=unclassified Frankia TaxID=2632575 RepID=UPI0019347B36|nr:MULTISPECIES: hypothetical protein [unclassified Frankia]MBL7487880.1 hypothetical protein [Frankia sp. AgW1.1]MBL7549945.1 hypothetical protein [Frankia sp. AgB1.9]MBL7621476.1 hypothetical protein [Frankia sp. AgB1.8]
MPAIRFVLNGHSYELTGAEVESRLVGVTPEPVREHAVLVNGAWFPVKQAFEAAVGLPRAEFISHAARRHLAALGFEVRRQIAARGPDSAGTTKPQSSVGALPAAGVPTVPRDGAEGEWHTETNVQAAVVSALAAAGWRILSVANTATKERGVDVVASRDGGTVGVEVKGYPSRGYADPARAGETKPTSPSTQAGHWFAQAVLAAMRLRGKQPHWRSVIALPDFSRYRDLHTETAGSLDAALIEVWWVGQDGVVSTPRPLDAAPGNPR